MSHTANDSISRFPVPAPGELPPDLAQRIAEVADKSGFVPHIFMALAWRPVEWRAFFAYHDALMDKDSPSLSKADRELIVVVTSAANDCLYCVVAHGAIVRIRARDPHLADQVAVDWRKAPLSAAQRAMLEVALLVAVDPAAVRPDHFEQLAAAGFTQDDIWDIGSIAALFALSNRLAHWAAVPPNDEFYLLGRVRRE
ncbi:MAG: peroxidase-related enzyme [Geodermatophilaceae bacterium]|nr:peroxidase-related enzyme [Geodermatophilaceae bacterium]MDQ3476376.1 peroxidase-related enzyme [Actinomycetota bacterium]